ncbi:MAG: phytanoyl-CoA dioxygenase [Chryseobacterium sp.]|nr:MAG: phytanoyl-CoA dioxygenase [Chryseobacterium sp.]
MKALLDTQGFAILNNVLTQVESAALINCIEEATLQLHYSQRSDELFAIRQFLKQVPGASIILNNSRLPTLIQQHFGDHYFIVKSIYFDKPPTSNWFVSYHQDLTISVDSRAEIPGYTFWTVKESQFAVRPPLTILEDNFTVRLHLDQTTSENGALKVFPQSHLRGVLRSDDLKSFDLTEQDCEVEAGGAMFMKPLLMHSSGRSTNGLRRRVIHIEFSRQDLPSPLNWAEKNSVAYS